MIKVFSYASSYPFSFILCILLAAVPSIVWIWVFNKKHREKKSAIILSFILGMGSALLVLFYQFYWGRKFNLGFFSLEPINFQENIHSHFAHPIVIAALVFLSVGFLEEYLKHWVIKKADQRYFRCVDDVIELSIFAALGFAFLENIGYFFQMILRGQIHNLMSLFVMRSIFVVFIHILCSGIYGYFYGTGYFSKPIFEDERKEGKTFLIPEILHRLFHFKRERIFHDEMISLGLIVSVLLHGLYDFILDVNLSIGKILNIRFLDNFMLHQFALPVFLIFGMFFLDKLINKKEDKKIFGHKVIREDFS